MTPAGQPIDFRARRIALVACMAKDLIAYDSLACERDSIRALFGRGYAMGDIALLIGDARQVAMEHIAAREMARS